MNTTVSRRLAAAAAASLGAVVLSACGSASRPSSTGPTVATTVPGTVVTTVPSTVVTTVPSRAVPANSVCTNIKSTLSALSSINLSSPSSIESHTNTVANDMSRLDTDVTSGSVAPSGSHVQTMVSDVEQAIHQGESAASQLAKANAGNAKAAFQTMISDLDHARAAGARADLSNCA